MSGSLTEYPVQACRCWLKFVWSCLLDLFSKILAMAIEHLPPA